DDLAVVVVGETDDGRLEHARQLGEMVLDLARVDVLPTADDHLLRPTRHREHAALVHRREVARAQPAVGSEGCGGRFRVTKVSREEVRTARLELAELPALTLPARRGINDARLDAGERAADRVE